MKKGSQTICCEPLQFIYVQKNVQFKYPLQSSQWAQRPFVTENCLPLKNACNRKIHGTQKAARDEVLERSRGWGW